MMNQKNYHIILIWLFIAITWGVNIFLFLGTKKGIIQFDTLKTHYLVVVNKEGKECIGMGALPEGTVLTLADVTSNASISMIVSEENCVFNMQDAIGMWRVALILLSDGTPEFIFYDEKERPRIEIRIHKTPSIRLLDTTGKEIFRKP